MAPCPCASGLRRLRCCEASPAAWPSPEAAAALDAQAQDATKLFNEKKYTEAEALALKLLDLAPNQRIALRVLFELRKAQNRPTPAEVLVRRLAGLPGTPALRAAANSLAAQYIIGQGRYAQAEPFAAAALTATPRDATAHHVMGVVLTETGKLLEGERHYRRALALLGRDDGMVLANTAWNLKLQGRLGEAAALYETALALRPDNKRGVGGQAQVEFSRGNVARAMSVLEDGLVRWPGDKTLRLLRALADLNVGNAQAVLDRLAEAPEPLLGPELAARGQALARLGKPAEAVSHYAAAKKLLRERNGLVYQAEELQKKFELYKAYFTAERTLSLPRAAAAGPQPVFLLGYPRSGTSLLEQLLAQLPGVAAGDEFGPIASLAESVSRPDKPYPEALDALLVADGWDIPGQLRDRYFFARKQVGLLGPGTRFITDRNASNAWHLGLIKLLFPEAPIIHVLRHPLDVMLSNLSQDRKLEGNAHVSMAAAARHYALTMSLIKHYRGQLTLRYLPLRYEDAVQDPAAALRQVAAFIGAEGKPPSEFDLRANAAPAAEPVPAHAAGRAPVHTRARYAHRAYEAQMPNLFAEVREVLAPWIAELGYGDAA